MRRERELGGEKRVGKEEGTSVQSGCTSNLLFIFTMQKAGREWFVGWNLLFLGREKKTEKSINKFIGKFIELYEIQFFFVLNLWWILQRIMHNITIFLCQL